MLLELYLMHLMAEAAKAHLTDDLSVRAREEEERRRLAGQPIVIAAREEVNAIIANPVMVGMSPAQALVASGAKKEGDLKGMSEDDIREQLIDVLHTSGMKDFKELKNMHEDDLIVEMSQYSWDAIYPHILISMGWVSEEECAKMAYSEQRDVVVMELMNAFPHTDAQLLKESRDDELLDNVKKMSAVLAMSQADNRGQGGR